MRHTALKRTSDKVYYPTNFNLNLSAKQVLMPDNLSSNITLGTQRCCGMPRKFILSKSKMLQRTINFLLPADKFPGKFGETDKCFLQPLRKLPRSGESPLDKCAIIVPEGAFQARHSSMGNGRFPRMPSSRHANAAGHFPRPFSVSCRQNEARIFPVDYTIDFRLTSPTTRTISREAALPMSKHAGSLRRKQSAPWTQTFPWTTSLRRQIISVPPMWLS